MNYLVHLFKSLFVLLFDLLLLLLFLLWFVKFSFLFSFFPFFSFAIFRDAEERISFIFFFINQLSLYFSFCHETLSF